MDNTTLLPCPFCGSKAIFATDKKNWVICPNCLSESRLYDTTEQAVKAWNRRQPIQDLLEKLAKHDR